MWPFSKDNDEAPTQEFPAVVSPETSNAPEASNGADPNRGPFDGDSVDIADFDFSDFSDGILDLGSVKLPMPRPSEVQVEMGPDGPRMVHVVTKVGRVTPVAFASSISGGLWDESTAEILAGMRTDGLDAVIEDGPWGPEIVGKTEHATIRMIGVEGNRWTLRMTLAAPNETAEDLKDLGREIVARTFVYRGENPMMAGTVLPVVMPAPLVEQVERAIKERAAQAETAQHQPARPKAAPQQPSQPEVTQQQPAQPEPVAPVSAPEPDPFPLHGIQQDSGSALQQMQAREALRKEKEGR